MYRRRAEAVSFVEMANTDERSGLRFVLVREIHQKESKWTMIIGVWALLHRLLRNVPGLGDELRQNCSREAPQGEGH